MKPTPYRGWAFAWFKPHPRPFITRLVASTRRDLVVLVEKTFGEPWKQIRKDGGRCIKVTISQA